MRLMGKMNDNKKFQNEIARRVIIHVALLTMALCSLLMAVFDFEIYRATRTELTSERVIHMFGEVLIATVIFYVLTLVALYFVSRSVAKKSLQPLKDALERELSFTSYASHEFRTPLSVLKGSMEVLIRKPRSQSEYEEKIKECLGEVDKMSEMLEDLLTLTRVENGRMMLHDETISVADLLDSITSQHAEELLGRNIHIDIRIFPEETTVKTDRMALGSIMSNIIGNAVKYCDNGGSITITSQVTDGMANIAVTNTGHGIPREEIDLIWNKFYRGAETGNQHIRGYGLGLSIIRHFSDLIGANVIIDSDRDQPTTVTLSLPVF